MVDEEQSLPRPQVRVFDLRRTKGGLEKKRERESKLHQSCGVLTNEDSRAPFAHTLRPSRSKYRV